MNKILVCDDENDIVKALEIYLTSEGYEVIKAGNGKEALEILENESGDISLILLDVMMPVMDGITTMKHLREKYNIPVILLTAKSEDTDKVLGLNIGADDYVTKPFSPTELLARVRSQVRRYTMLGGAEKTENADVISVGNIDLDVKKRTVTVDGEPIALTATEYDILRLFMSHPGEVFSTKEIYKSVWKQVPIGEENTIAVHIRHLREKIEINPAEPRCLKVVWGQGYKLEGSTK